MPKGFPIVQFDMYTAEDWGFHKYDVLSQRGLGHIKDAVALIEQNQGKAVDIRQVEKLKVDPRVRTQLRSGQAIGCFYVESPAMRGLLSKLRCDTYVHLVAASSIIRPGVSKSGMMREYIKRFHQPNRIPYLHPVFKKHLGETFGVMVYQEDVMKICHHFAGLDLDESDVLRRIMTGKRKASDTFERLRNKYFRNCEALGYPPTLSQEVWRQIESFGGYSFCKAHSASFAMESFQSLYLKAYYPLEFMVAVINNFGGFYRTEIYVHEARRQGASIHPPCVNHSLYLTTIIGTDLYLGFVHLHQMERQVAHRIVRERAVRGIFRSLADFVQRVSISAEQLEILIRIGAFLFTGMNKHELMWEKNAVFNPGKQIVGQTLFDDPNTFSLPELKELPFAQAWEEMDLLGFPLCSPFDLLDRKPATGITTQEFEHRKGQVVEILGYYVCKKHVRTVNKKQMFFGTWLDETGDFFDTVHFPPSLKEAPFRGHGVYWIKGRIVEDFGFLSIEVVRMERLAWRQAK